MDAPGLIIRADATPDMGAGHVMRCLALARAWRDRGGRALFVGRVEGDALRGFLAGQGFAVREPGPEPDDTLALLDGLSAPGCWVVLDGYHFGAGWRAALRAKGYRLLVLDDHAEPRPVDADAVLAPSWDGFDPGFRVPAGTVILPGARYRLLRREFARRVEGAPGPGKGLRALVTFGGADSQNATARALAALDNVLGPEDTVVVVLGRLNAHGESVARVLSGAGYAHQVLTGVDDMAALMACADLAVAAGGGTGWELAAMGVPSLLVRLASNQGPNVDALARGGAALALDAEALETPACVDALRRLAGDAALRRSMSGAGRALVDGRGADRVCRILECMVGQGDVGECALRAALADDADQIFRISNAPDVRAASFSPDPIAYRDHLCWFEGRLASPDTVFHVLDLEGLVVALARYDKGGDGWAGIDVAVHGAFRGLGLGSAILARGAAEAARALGAAGLRAEVLAPNAASRRCFAKAGFREAGPVRVRDRDCVVFELAAAHAGSGHGEPVGAAGGGR